MTNKMLHCGVVQTSLYTYALNIVWCTHLIHVASEEAVINELRSQDHGAVYEQILQWSWNYVYTRYVTGASSYIHVFFRPVDIRYVLN